MKNGSFHAISRISHILKTVSNLIFLCFFFILKKKWFEQKKSTKISRTLSLSILIYRHGILSMLLSQYKIELQIYTHKAKEKINLFFNEHSYWKNMEKPIVYSRAGHKYQKFVLICTFDSFFVCIHLFKFCCKFVKFGWFLLLDI